jgi:preprotein translocase subunit SecE
MATNVREKSEGTIKPKKEKARGSGAAPAAAARSHGPFDKAVRYLGEVQTELRKTTWPSKQELIASTQVVIGLLVVVGVYIWGVDLILSFVFRVFHLGPSGK